jgi:hypothetical protein
MPLLVAAGRRVIAVDPRGYGDSDRPSSKYDMTTVAANFMASPKLSASLPLSVLTWLATTLALDRLLLCVGLPGRCEAPGLVRRLASWHHTPAARRNPVCRGECEDLALRLQSARRPAGNPDPGSRARVSDSALPCEGSQTMGDRPGRSRRICPRALPRARCAQPCLITGPRSARKASHKAGAAPNAS